MNKVLIIEFTFWGIIGLILLIGSLSLTSYLWYKYKKYNSDNTKERIKKVKDKIKNNEISDESKLSNYDFIFFINYMKEAYSRRSGLYAHSIWIILRCLLVANSIYILIILWLLDVLKILPTNFFQKLLSSYLITFFVVFCFRPLQKVWSVKFKTDTLDVYNDQQFLLVLEKCRVWNKKNNYFLLNNIEQKNYDEQKIELWIYCMITKIKDLNLQTSKICDRTFHNEKNAEIINKLKSFKLLLSYSSEEDIDILLSKFN